MKRFTILVEDEDAEMLGFWAMRHTLKICAGEVKTNGPTVPVKAFFADGQEPELTSDGR